MSIKSTLAKVFAKKIYNQTLRWANKPVATQNKVFKSLVQNARETEFGKDHQFASIKTIEDFQKKVPVRDYEDLKSYIDKVKTGERDILWKGKPLYFAKTSGTTSGAKYIPLSKESMPTHIQASR